MIAGTALSRNKCCKSVAVPADAVGWHIALLTVCHVRADVLSRDDMVRGLLEREQALQTRLSEQAKTIEALDDELTNIHEEL